MQRYGFAARIYCVARLTHARDLLRFAPCRNADGSVGVVAQLVRVPACHAGGCGFDSRPPRLFEFGLN